MFQCFINIRTFHVISLTLIPRHVILKGISSQVQSACDRVNAGIPTAMAASNLIAIGTSHGFILVFDVSQVSYTFDWSDLI